MLFSNEQRLIMHDRRGKLNRFIDCSENQYEVSIQMISSMLRTRKFKARGMKDLDSLLPLSQDMSILVCGFCKSLGACRQTIPLAAFKC